MVRVPNGPLSHSLACDMALRAYYLALVSLRMVQWSSKLGPTGHTYDPIRATSHGSLRSAICGPCVMSLCMYVHVCA